MIQELRRKGDITAEDLKASTETLWFFAHGLQMATQGVVDVAMHVSVALSARAPDDYRSAIEALGKLHVLEEDSADRIAPMAGLRNVLLHGYLRLDADRLATP